MLAVARMAEKMREIGIRNQHLRRFVLEESTDLTLKEWGMFCSLLSLADPETGAVLNPIAYQLDREGRILVFGTVGDIACLTGISTVVARKIIRNLIKKGYLERKTLYGQEVISIMPGLEKMTGKRKTVISFPGNKETVSG